MKNTMHLLRLLPLAFLIGSLISASLSAQTPKETQTKESFTFGKVDLALLEQSDLLDTKLAKEGLIYDDKELGAYVTRIGESLLPPGPPPERVQWRFRVLRNPLANAFALPNGSIYVHSGLLALLENESQIASVLAHEISHVRDRHSYLAYRDRRKKSLAINLLSIADSLSPFAHIGLSPITAYGLRIVIGTVASISQDLLIFSIFGYSRELERDADYYAANRLLESRYRPQELAGAFKLMQKDFEGEHMETSIFYSDHDKLDDRIRFVNQLIAGKTTQPEDATEAQAERARYFAVTEKVTLHNTQLTIDARRFRTAIALSEKLAANNSQAAENLAVLADAYRQLGPRSAALTEQERSGKGKKELQKSRQKMTFDEEERALLNNPAGQAALQENQRKAEEYYQKALSLDGANARAHLGLGLLYEAMNKPQQALAELKKFLELRPASFERQRILRRIEALEKAASDAPPKN